MTSAGGGPLEVESADPGPCPRCGGPGLLSARVPAGWVNGRGEQVHGTTLVILCPRCDAGDTEATPLLTFFAVHGRVTGATVTQFSGLLQAWARTARPARVDLAELDQEYDAWRRGEL